jgi:hypothetical protein
VPLRRAEIDCRISVISRSMSRCWAARAEDWAIAWRSVVALQATSASTASA